MSLALLGTGAVVIALAAGYGIAMLIGTPFTALSETLPFILLGIGIDIMFILVKGMEEINVRCGADLTPQQRFSRLMETSGLSSIIVGLTNIVSCYCCPVTL